MFRHLRCRQLTCILPVCPHAPRGDRAPPHMIYMGLLLTHKPTPIPPFYVALPPYLKYNVREWHNLIVKVYYSDDISTQLSILCRVELTERLVALIISSLTYNEGAILVRHYGLGGSSTYNLSEIGRQLGLSREVSRATHERALKKLKKVLKREDLREKVGSNVEW